MRKITIPKEAIQLDEARDIYQSMMNLLDENDADHMEIYENLVKKCVRYAEFRGQWPLLSTEKNWKSTVPGPARTIPQSLPSKCCPGFRASQLSGQTRLILMTGNA